MQSTKCKNAQDDIQKLLPQNAGCEYQRDKRTTRIIYAQKEGIEYVQTQKYESRKER